MSAALSHKGKEKREIPEFRPEFETATRAREIIKEALALPIDRSIDELAESKRGSRLVGMSPDEAKKLARAAILDAVFSASGVVWQPALVKIKVKNRRFSRRVHRVAHNHDDVSGDGEPGVEAGERGTIQDEFEILAKEVARLRHDLGVFADEYDKLARVHIIKNALEAHKKFRPHASAFLADIHGAMNHLSESRQHLDLMERLLGGLARDKQVGGAPGNTWHVRFAYALMPFWESMTGEMPKSDNNTRFIVFLQQALSCFSDTPHPGWQSSLKAASKLRKRQNLPIEGRHNALRPPDQV